ncbi:MAG: beta-ketoacyl-ACP synthase II [Vampirovibrio sp.]|jgi:beta-ketoacyl-acyl-carrier-protein synthase II|nr:beta-ketoacyl-ACP synthase II [Vampirovibrio sp.]
MNLKQRVVITGMGAISPIGSSLEAIWASCMASKSGIGMIENIAEDQRTCLIGGEVKDFDTADYMDKKEAKRMDRFTHFGIAASKLAFADSGLEGNIDKNRLGVVIGSGAGGLASIEGQVINCIEKGFNRCSPFLVPMMIPDMAAGRVSIALGAKGANMALVTACATGTDCIGQAMRMIQLGECDAVVAGGAEAPVNALSVAGFAAARALTPQKTNPEKASRPFDKDRDGFVIAEGSGILILEALEHAQARGAKIYAEVVGYGRSSDAHDIVMPHPRGEGAAAAMTAALRCANLKPEDISYINAHGTSTPLGDVAETLAIKHVFGDYAKNGLMVSSTKSMHGHMLGATGSFEALLCILALQHQVVPPTINLDEPGEGCDLDYVPNVPRVVTNMDYTMSNSFGFGGHNASIILKRWAE